MNKKVSDIVKKLFEEEIFDEHFNSEKNFLNLSKLLKEEVDNIAEKEDVPREDIINEIISVAENHKLFFDLARNQKDRRKILKEVFSDKTDIDTYFLNRLALNVIEAYKNEKLNVNKLYRRINKVDDIEDKKHIINDNVARFLQFSKEHELKEALGVINTFIEVSEFSKEDIDSLWEQSHNEDINLQYENFIYKILKEVNNTTLIENPFKIHKTKNKFQVAYNKKTAGLYDHFMYSPRSKKFGLNFSTASEGTEIEGDSLIKHSLSFLSTIHYLESWFEFDKLKKPSVKKVKELLYTTYTGYYDQKEFNKCLEESKYRDLFDERRDGFYDFKDEDLSKGVRGINKHLDFYIQDFIIKQNSKFPEDKIRIEKIYERDDLDSDFEKNTSEYSIDFSHHHIYNINKKQLNNLFNLVQSKFDIYYFGEVKSNRSKNLEYKDSSHFTNEELRAGLNMLAYTGKNSEGVFGVNISSEGLYHFFDNIKTRFNTSTKSKNHCLDIEKVDSNITAIGKIFIDNYILNKDLKEVLRNYKKENNQVIKNISNFEKNILLQVYDKINDTRCSPQKALNNVLKTFNINENIKFEDFIDTLRNKWRKIQDSSLSDNNTHIIDKLAQTQDTYLYNLEQKKTARLEKELEEMREKLKESGSKPKG